MNAPAPYPIHLRQVLFTRTSVIAIPGYELPKDGQGTVSPENTINVMRDPSNPRQFIATMRSIINKEESPASPYSIDMECVAQLETDGTLSVEEEVRGVTINAHSVCYGAIREAVAWLTARQPFGPVALGLSLLRTQSAESSVAGDGPSATSNV
jgi:hypothetical protein